MSLTSKFIYLAFVLQFSIVNISARSSRKGRSDCKYFMEFYNNASNLVTLRRNHEKSLQQSGFVLTPKDIGFFNKEKTDYNILNSWYLGSEQMDIMTTTAKLMADKNPQELDNFEDYSKCVIHSLEYELQTRPKYRPADGYGNNLKHPYWGTPGMPFTRFADKNYNDGINSITKSVTGSDLPSPRKIVQEVLLKAKKESYNPPIPNGSLSLMVLYIGHDLGHSVGVDAFDSTKIIRCCGSDNKGVLSPALSHSSCLPISIGQEDPFYGPSGTSCLNNIRSESTALPSTIKYGEVLNVATSFMDHSLIYGNSVKETNSVRSFKGGRFNMGKKNMLPVDKKGRYIKSSDRLWKIVPVGTIWPVMFTRNHNNVADGLRKLNPQWNDEKLFQEARRINIAWLQNSVFRGAILQNAFNKTINEVYNRNADPSCTNEFNTATYRFLHYYVPSDVQLTTKDGVIKNIPVSDTIGRVDIAENNFDDLVRGIFNQSANFGQYTDELYNKFAKNKKGVGMDLLSLDIQKGRDHGLPSFLDARRKCGLDDLKTFDDLLTFLPQSYVDLLENVYDSVEDIDLYVGGALESFTTVNKVLVGETFRCIIGDQYRHIMAGDAYYPTHSSNPYPFTNEQLNAIDNFKYPNMICSTTGLDYVFKSWAHIESSGNKKVPCSKYEPLDLSPWQE